MTIKLSHSISKIEKKTSEIIVLTKPNLCPYENDVKINGDQIITKSIERQKKNKLINFMWEIKNSLLSVSWYKRRKDPPKKIQKLFQKHTSVR